MAHLVYYFPKVAWAMVAPRFCFWWFCALSAGLRCIANLSTLITGVGVAKASKTPLNPMLLKGSKWGEFCYFLADLVFVCWCMCAPWLGNDCLLCLIHEGDCTTMQDNNHMQTKHNNRCIAITQQSHACIHISYATITHRLHNFCTSIASQSQAVTWQQLHKQLHVNCIALHDYQCTVHCT